MNDLLLRVIYGGLDAPRRLRDRLRSMRYKRSCTVAETATFATEAVVFNPIGVTAIRVGAQSLIMGELLVMPPNGSINIGEWCYIGPSSKIWAMSSVTVGNRVFISHGVQIFDNNSHSLSAQERHDRYHELRTQGRHSKPENVTTRPVTIEDDVWIGFNAAILKGVSLGRGAIIGACAVVLDDVPAYTMVGGNPARQIGESRA